jgi:hypothetical protein
MIMEKLSYRKRCKELLGILIVFPILIYYVVKFFIKGK